LALAFGRLVIVKVKLIIFYVVYVEWKLFTHPKNVPATERLLDLLGVFFRNGLLFRVFRAGVDDVSVEAGILQFDVTSTMFHGHNVCSNCITCKNGGRSEIYGLDAAANK
jgi:hypothetical protein